MSKAASKTDELYPNPYREEFRILSGSSARIIVTPTREPYRTANLLREWAQAKDQTPYYAWDVLHGWRKWEYQKGALETKGDKAVELFSALKKIRNLDGNGKEFDDGIYVVHYPHWNLKQHPGLIQLLKQYARTDFSEAMRRMVLLVPEGFTLPKELENDLVILEAGLPDRTELRSYYDVIVQSVDRSTNGKAPKYGEAEIEEIISTASGMTEMEFKNAITRAVVTNRLTLPDTPLADFLKVIAAAKIEVVKRSEVLEVYPSLPKEEVGGLEHLMASLEECHSVMCPEARAFGVDAPKGYVLIGPPGTGKSLAAKVAGSILHLPLVRFDVGRVFNSLVGESEARVRSSLRLLDAMAPCIAFIDEVDKAGLDPRQGSGDSGVGQRIMGTILTHMQESTSGIFWIATANRIASLPPEFLRAGRFDAVFAVMPPNEAERAAVINIHLKKRKQNPAKVDIRAVVDRSEGYVSAEIEGAIKDAVKTACVRKVPVTADLIIEKLGNRKPISEAFADDFNAMAEWAKNNATPASKPDDPKPAGGLISRRKRSAPDASVDLSS